MKTKKSSIQEWGEKINWDKRVIAICKPCWEIKYCPYGPLVEKFPLKISQDKKSCRIFGHNCPVFYVAEPFTETKELRNISRKIPRVVQFRVLKRENQICSVCGNSVKDEDIEFDHIIPWSKGGSSDENNVRLLCEKCNRKKGTKFEDRYLIDSLSDHLTDTKPIKIDIIKLIIEFVKLFHKLAREENRRIIALDICKLFGRRKVKTEDEKTIEFIKDIEDFFKSEKPEEIKQSIFKALKYRWGFIDNKLHKLNETARKYDMNIDELLLAEASFQNRLGFPIKLTETIKRKWLEL